MKNKKRVIIVTLIMAVIVMALVVVIIVAATSRTKKPETASVVSSGTVAVDQSEENGENIAMENPAPVSNEGDAGTIKSEPIIITVPEPEVAEESTLPATGPLDLLPIALIFGSLTTYLASLKLAKSEA